MRAFVIIQFIVAFIVSTGFCAKVRAEGLEPESSLVTTSAKNAFPLESRFPREWWFELEQQNYIGFTNIFIGERNFAAAGESIMSKPERTCSIYDSTVCFDISDFFHSDIPQIVVSGYAKMNGNNALIFALDSGYSTKKITISPALMIGLSHRYYLTERRDTQFIIEAAGWVGQSVSHTPCIDSYDRKYYCGNLSAWSDFKYNPHPDNFYLKLWFDYAF